MRAQGAGGQNVNKVSSAVHLRFDIRNSSLAPDHKERLLALADQRITRDGVLVIKAQTQRSQDMNRAEAWGRLQELVDSVAAAAPAAAADQADAGVEKAAAGGQEPAFPGQDPARAGFRNSAERPGSVGAGYCRAVAAPPPDFCPNVANQCVRRYNLCFTTKRAGTHRPFFLRLCIQALWAQCQPRASRS